MTDAEILAACKKALRITKTTYDDELKMYRDAAKLDLGIAGVLVGQVDDLVAKAIITYVSFSFGKPKNYAELKASYDEQKAQLQTASGYTNWGDQ